MDDLESVCSIAKTLPVGFACVICENPLDFEDICLGNGQCPCCNNPNSYGGKFVEIYDLQIFISNVYRFVALQYMDKKEH